jgi:hypothetical protein
MSVAAVDPGTTRRPTVVERACRFIAVGGALFSSNVLVERCGDHP